MGKKAPRENRFEFDHIYPLDYGEYIQSPVTGIKQFRISGNDCARRSWDLVYRHCMNDTVLLCRECHYQQTRKRIAWMHRAEGAQMLNFYRVNNVAVPDEVSGILQLRQ